MGYLAFASTFPIVALIETPGMWPQPRSRGQESGGISMVMEPVSVESAIEKAKKKGLKPGRVRGTKGIQFTKGRDKRIEVISWDEFRETLEKRRLHVYESSGNLKIMKKRRRA